MITTGYGRRWQNILGLGAVVLALAGCARATDPLAGNAGGALDPNALGSSLERAAPGSAKDFATNVGDRVWFEVDSAVLSAQARVTLDNQAAWLTRYPHHRVTIEGHADERGTREYNIALGARRAMATRNYLAAQGVRSDRLRTLSYGKERPVALCNDISCWSKNRRAVTVLRGAGS